MNRMPAVIAAIATLAGVIIGGWLNHYFAIREWEREGAGQAREGLLHVNDSEGVDAEGDLLLREVCGVVGGCARPSTSLRYAQDERE